MAQRFDVGDRVFIASIGMGGRTGVVVGRTKSRWFGMTAFVVHLDEPLYGREEIAVFPGRLMKVGDP